VTEAAAWTGRRRLANYGLTVCFGPAIQDGLPNSIHPAPTSWADTSIDALSTRELDGCVRSLSIYRQLAWLRAAVAVAVFISF